MGLYSYLGRFAQTSGKNMYRTSHAEIVIREFVMKLKGTWDYPYKDEEICHCRHVKTKTVDQAIVNGAHTHELASRWTGCSTACGTCKPDVEKIIKYRIG